MTTLFRAPINFLELFLLLAVWKSHGLELLNDNDVSAAAVNINSQADDVESNEVQNDDISGFCYHKKNGLYPYNGNCSKYITCSNGYIYVMPCPNGLWFDTSANVCNYPDVAVNSRCQATTALKTTSVMISDARTTPTVTDSTSTSATTYQPPARFCNGKKTGNYPEPTRCDGYIACVHGTAVFMKCPAGLYYHASLGVCDWKYNVVCQKSITTESTTTQVTATQPVTTALLRTTVTTTTETTSASTYKPPAGFCNGKITGNYPAPTRCDGYIACVHGTSIFMKCPADLQYNATLDICDWKRNVVCPHNLIHFHDDANKVQEDDTSDSRVDVIKSVISVACRNKPPGNYAYPSSCTRFIHCDGTGQGNVRMCQKESNFDPEYHVCVWNKIYPCETIKPKTMRIPTTTSSATTTRTYQMTQKSEKPAITSAHTTIKTISQAISNKSATTIDTKTTLHSTILTLSTTYQPPETFCNDRKTGNYPDPRRCDGYITCVHDRAIFVKCPAGLGYSPVLGVCDWQLKTDCQQRSKGIILSTSAVNTPKITKYTPPRGFCTEMPDGNYADPMRCDGFVVCSKNKAVFMRCPENLLYNAATDWCDYPTNVKCHVNEKKEFTCNNKKEGTYKSPSKCNQYYICTGNSDMAIFRTCPKHTNFHPETKACVFTFSYSCEDPTFCQKKPDGKYINNNNCYGYYECLSGRTHPRNCENGLRFNGMECVTSVNYTCK